MIPLGRSRMPCLVLVLALALLLALPVAATAFGKPTAAHAKGAEGRYYLFRTLENGTEPSDEQLQRCAEHLGPVRAAAAVKFVADLYVPVVDLASGLVVDDTARRISPGFACIGPGAEGLDGYGAFALPGVGDIEVFGPVDIGPSSQPGTAVIHARVQVLLDHARGILGGFATTNSVLNPGNAVPGAPTGSIWTVYVVRARSAPPAPPLTPVDDGKPNLAPQNPAQFLVARGIEERPRSDCPLSLPSETVRISKLHAESPDLATDLLGSNIAGRPLGRLTVCYRHVLRGIHAAVATARVPINGTPTVITAHGVCRDIDIAAHPARPIQSCNLDIDADSASGIRGGLLVSAGPPRRRARVAPARSPVWTFSIFKPQS